MGNIFTSKSFEELPKRVYHGTTADHIASLSKGIKVNTPSANPSPDFGKGFYTTSQLKQAEVQAIRKTKFFQKQQNLIKSNIVTHPVVFEYTVDVEKLLKITSVIKFDTPDEEWGKFIISNRLGIKVGSLHNFEQDIAAVFGPVADGHPFIGSVLNDYKKRIITLEELIIKLKPDFKNGYLPDQLSVHTEQAADCLILQGVKAVK
ncbi:hypothetical protein D3C75_518350 [compost metagenome]